MSSTRYSKPMLLWLTFGGASAAAFEHPGLLHSADDLARVKEYVDSGEEPWHTAWEHLKTSDLASSDWTPSPHDILIRSSDADDGSNYPDAYKDAHAAYQLAIRWLISGETEYADTAATILDAWSSTLTDIGGNSDMYLAAGLYGYQFANAAELLRNYSGWSGADDFGTMLREIFAPYNRVFLDEHIDQPDFYYANWDQCNIAAYMAIGIYNDDQDMFDFAVDYFLNGPTDGAVANGALPWFSIANFTDPDIDGKTLMEGQEAGRDQGHSLLDFGLLGVIGQQGLNQGVDLFGAFGNQILNAAEYVAKYNTGHDVPYTAYESWEGNLTEISADSRGEVRPGFELLVAHYTQLKGLDTTWSTEYRDYVNDNATDGIEGGGGDFGPNSGGFDVFGYGTLMHRLKE